MEKIRRFQKNETVVVEIEDIGSDGEGIGRVDGFTLFVKDAVVGDTVEARIVKGKKSYAYARLEKVIKPSPFRVEPKCICHRQCGGCQLQALSYEKQLEYKQKKIRDSLVRIGGFAPEYVDGHMEPIVGMEEPFRYRNKAQYPVGTDRNGRVITGFYAGRTHSIIANTDCQLGVQENQEILECILEYMRENKVSAYDEGTGTGLVRHVLIRKGFASGEIMVCLVINRKVTHLSNNCVKNDLHNNKCRDGRIEGNTVAEKVDLKSSGFMVEGVDLKSGRLKVEKIDYKSNKLKEVDCKSSKIDAEEIDLQSSGLKVEGVDPKSNIAKAEETDRESSKFKTEKIDSKSSQVIRADVRQERLQDVKGRNLQSEKTEYLPHQEKLINKLARIKGMTSVSVSINTEKTNVIMGTEIHTLWGRDTISDTIHVRDMTQAGYPFTGEGLTFRISPLSFYQVNPRQTEKLYSLALEYAGLTGKETVWDLYCGIGTISLFLAGSARKVYGVEIVPQAIADARENAGRNGIENAEFFVGKAEEVLGEFYDENADARKPDVIVVDPPRKGCDGNCLEAMLRVRPERIVYVSCDPATLARDLRVLCDGGYAVERIRGADMFGMTVHVETVCLLSNRKSKPDTHVKLSLSIDDYCRIKEQGKDNQ